MRLRYVLIATTCMSVALITGLAKALPPDLIHRNDFRGEHFEEGEPPTSVMLPIPPSSISGDKVLESVYYDSLAILSRKNRCSDFFGGPALSTQVFNELVGKARKDYLSTSTAMRMQGPTILGHIRSTPRYRLFSKVSINANGPFYKRTNFRSERTVTGVGTFSPNTREVRMLILLHELGHLLKGTDGNWLLPDDGGDEPLSRKNSGKIEEVCGQEIKRLDEPQRNLARRIQPDEKVAADHSDSEQ